MQRMGMLAASSRCWRSLVNMSCIVLENAAFICVSLGGRDRIVTRTVAQISGEHGILKVSVQVVEIAKANSRRADMMSER